MSRLAGVSDGDAGLMTRAAYSGAKHMIGDVPEPMRIMAHSPWVFRASGAFEMAMRQAKAVPENLKILASIKVSALAGCVF